jgi:hypothetical protein
MSLVGRVSKGFCGLGVSPAILQERSEIAEGVKVAACGCPAVPGFGLGRMACTVEQLCERAGRVEVTLLGRGS